MTSPEGVLATPSPSKRRLIWPWLLGLVLVLGVGLFLATNPSRWHTSERPGGGVTVTNAAQAVPLAQFTQTETRRWHSVPRGTLVCDGVTFVCDGAIRTAGLGAARDGSRYPGAVLGVPVNRRGSRIHLLQAAENTSDVIEGTPYGRMVLHYANGESRKFDLLFGVHGEDWYQRGPTQAEPVADPNSKVAWTQRRTGDNMTIRLYHTALENLLPEINITAVDFISPLGEANLLLFGLTVDDDSRPLSPSYGPGETIADASSEPITFSVQDLAGRPAPGASLSWTAQGPRIRIEFPPFRADAEGQVRVEVPRKFIREIHYQASAPDGSNISGTVQLNRNGASPTKVVLKLREKEK